MEQADLLAAFGQNDWFRAAFQWDLDQIFAWMDRASKGLAGGQSTTHEGVQKLLQATLSKIRTLSLPHGNRFQDVRPNVQPDSHFARIYNEARWANGTQTGTESKFELQEWPSIFRRGIKDREASNIYWNPYDLLGGFLSVLGPAPQAANKNNFFLPLASVYARWCSKIAGHAPRVWNGPAQNGAGNWPFMFQCTWYDDPAVKPKKWFFLGASIGGDEWKEANVGQFKDTVQRHRFDMLLRKSQTKLVLQKHWDKKLAPEQVIGGGNHTPYGSCAEGYPFVEMMSSDPVKNRLLYGLALKREFMNAENLNIYNGRRDDNIWKQKLLAAPCRNCKALIRKGRGREPNFAWDLDIPPVA